MTDLLTGTLTFLYTDIEGSTLRWEQHPEAMKLAVERHDAILRDAIEADGGVVFRRMGDAFCAAFSLATQAVDAVLSAQRALYSEKWDPQVAPIKVRMALHTGQGEIRDGDYVGAHLNRIARLLAVEHGGQTLLTHATYELVCDSLPDNAGLIDLGEHRLRDLQRPERIFQLTSPDLPSDFPPIKTLNYRPNNLPVQPTDFIGREKQVELVRELLARPQVRLLTLSGPGGTGKTRLSLQVGALMLDNYQDGVFFVPLTSIGDSALVPGAIADALGVAENGERPVVENLKHYVGQKKLLLILDNFEQVVSAAPVVSELLSTAPQLKALVTSREVLHLYGEKEFPVPPLQLPNPQRLPPLQDLASFESVRLFIERATSVKPGFALAEDNAAAIAEICNRLDGLPLAIELAAARIKLLTPQAILSRLESRLKVLTGGARDLPARQQTLRGAIDWSYDMLPTEERTLFQRMSVFVGGCTFEAAEAVCDVGVRGERRGASNDADSEFLTPHPSPLTPLDIDILDGLASLVDKSLLRQIEVPDSDARFAMLETIREYALERLEKAGDLSATRRAHAEYYLLMAEQAAPKIQTLEQKSIARTLEAEHDNLRAALEWSLTGEGDREIGLRIGIALHRFWHIKGHLSEGTHWMRPLLASTPERTQLRGQALYATGYMTFLQGDGSTARTLLEESAAISRELGDTMGLAYASYLLGVAMAFGGDPGGSKINAEGAALFRQLGAKGRPGLVLALLTMGMLVFLEGDYFEARKIFEENRVLSKEIGDMYGFAQVSNYLGDIARIECNYPSAGTLYGESLALMEDQGGRGDIPAMLHNIGYVALAEHDYERASSLFKESLALQREIGNKQGISECLTGFASLAGAQGDARRAARLFGAAEAIRLAIGAYMWPAERIEWERNVAIAKAQLDEPEWEAARQEGFGMMMEKAIEYALSTS